MSAKTVAAVVLTAAVAAGCSAGTNQTGSADQSAEAQSLPQRTAESPAEFTAMLQQMYHGDYTVVDSPALLADQADAVVIGQILDVAVGPSTRTSPDDELHNLLTSFVLTVAVNDVVKDETGVVTEGFVYVQIPRGNTMTAEPFGAALPRTSSALLYLDDTRDEKYEFGVVDPHAGHPEGTTLTTPYPQGFIFAVPTDGALLGVEDLGAMPTEWQGFTTLEQLVTASR